MNHEDVGTYLNVFTNGDDVYRVQDSFDAVVDRMGEPDTPFLLLTCQDGSRLFLAKDAVESLLESTPGTRERAIQIERALQELGEELDRDKNPWE
jgi:hypothetical protein